MRKHWILLVLIAAVAVYIRHDKEHDLAIEQQQATKHEVVAYNPSVKNIESAVQLAKAPATKTETQVSAVAKVRDQAMVSSEERVTEYLSDAFPAGKIIASKMRADGTHAATEELADGGRVDRVWRIDGSVMSEKWDSADGTEVDRGYHSNGVLRTMFLRRSDGTRVMILQNPEGLIESRTDVGLDGSRTVMHFDDRGEPAQRQHTAADGTISFF